MELSGYQFTWEWGRGTNKWTEIRLDRALVSQEWLMSFQDAKLTNMEVSTSDHCPILLEPVVEKINAGLRKFRFENAWLHEPMCGKIVEETWASSSSITLGSKLKECSKSLASWGQEITGSFKKRIDQSKKIIKMVRGRRDELSVKQFQDKNKKLTEVLTQQEVF
ncbi:uncharacterized protein LOC141689198 [Apium graveolens]|uniref:uncharacterized protein LOC141689198 n=1 Tax=Apium graveolens TaxID=4045 RepID=UPI003D7B8FE3